MNPWPILAAVLLIGAAWFGGDHAGYVRGENAQKVADQKEFKRVENALTDQKAEANAAYRAFQAHNLELVVKHDELKSELEKKREETRRITDARRDKYADVGLRFSAAADTGCRVGGDPTISAKVETAYADAATTVQLPGPLAANLRRLAYDADELNDDYRKCYEFVNSTE